MEISALTYWFSVTLYVSGIFPEFNNKLIVEADCNEFEIDSESVVALLIDNVIIPSSIGSSKLVVIISLLSIDKIIFFWLSFFSSEFSSFDVFSSLFSSELDTSASASTAFSSVVSFSVVFSSGLVTYSPVLNSFSFSVPSLLNSICKYTTVPDVVVLYVAATFFKFSFEKYTLDLSSESVILKSETCKILLIVWSVFSFSGNCK